MQLEARLRAFAAVARAGSLSGAARELYVSQPAISKHLASLEAELGKALVTRGRTGVTLTSAGQVLADFVLRAETLLANAGRALAGHPTGQTGILSIAAAEIPGTYVLPELLAVFQERHPGVEFEFEVTTSAEALELVRTHRAELGVAGGLPVPPDLQSEPLLEDEVVLIGPPELGGRRLRPQDLDGWTWFLRDEGSAAHSPVEAVPLELGLESVPMLELPSWEAVKLAVAKGAGVAAISRLALELEGESGKLVVLDMPRWRLAWTMSAIHARGVPLTPPAARFRELLLETFEHRPSPAHNGRG